MADIRISPASMEALKARLATPEGKAALRKLGRLIAESAFEAMPHDLRESLTTAEGMEAFRKAWPDIVEAFLFRGVRKPEPQSLKIRARAKTGKVAPARKK